MTRRATLKYPNYGTPNNFPEYTAHNGQQVEVISEVSDEENPDKADVGPMWNIRAEDGWTGIVYEHELEFKD